MQPEYIRPPTVQCGLIFFFLEHTLYFLAVLDSAFTLCTCVGVKLGEGFIALPCHGGQLDYLW